MEFKIIDETASMFGDSILSAERQNELSEKLDRMSNGFMGAVRTCNIFSDIATFCKTPEELVYCTVLFTRGIDTELNETHESLVIFSHTEPHKIGAESDEYKDKLSDDLPNIQVIFKFTKPESITALIHTLVEVQKQLF